MRPPPRPFRNETDGVGMAGPVVTFIMGSLIGGNYAVVTQLGECKTEDLEVAGSSPAHGTIFLPFLISD